MFKRGPTTWRAPFFAFRLLFCIGRPKPHSQTAVRFLKLFDDWCSVAPRTFHAAHGRGKPGSKVERTLDGLGAIFTTLGGIEIAHQKRGEERGRPAPMVVLHVRYRFSQLAVITLAVVSNAALGARRSRHKTRTRPFTHARRSRISSSLAASTALKKAKST